jgi:GNAT superfamily N-acetyltransferase
MNFKNKSFKLRVVWFIFSLLASMSVNTELYASCEVVEENGEIVDIQHKLMRSLSSESVRLKNVSATQEKCFSLENNAGEWVGGIAGYTLYGSLVIDMFWIEKSYRRQGLGRKLVTAFEGWGRKQGVKFIKLSTMEWWGAVPFYEALGYKVISEDDGYEGGAKQFTLKKVFIDDGV